MRGILQKWAPQKKKMDLTKNNFLVFRDLIFERLTKKVTENDLKKGLPKRIIKIAPQKRKNVSFKNGNAGFFPNKDGQVKGGFQKKIGSQ